MSSNLALKTNTHVVDILGNVIGRDQPIMVMEKALNLVGQLGNEIFLDDDVVFFDPFCKAGELLLACALSRCNAINKSQNANLNLIEIQKELYESNRYFALAPDERHHRLSLRTFLGNTNSHLDQFTHIIRDGHYLSEVDGTFDKDKFEKEFNSMIEYIKKTSKKNKIIAIGNPPYQESDGGFGKSATSIYNYFVDALIDSKDINEFVLVIPSRWFGGGKGLDDFRSRMMESNKIKNLRYFKNSSEVFPTVDINGGICFLNYAKDFDGETTFSDGKYTETLKLNEFDIITDDPKGYSIVRKIQGSWKGQYVGSVAWARKPFGLATDHFSKNKNHEVASTAKNAVACLCRYKEVKFIDRKYIEKNADKIEHWKVSIPAVAGGSKGNRRSTIPLNQIFIIPKGTITSETYSIIDTFTSKEKAENLLSYLKTDFARYLVGLRKITQHVPRDRWDWVPYVDITKPWTDDELFKLFKISKEEQEHIKAKVQEWS